jgi:dTMP kinase
LLAGALGAVLTREPGGTPLGEQVRALLLDPASGDINARAEALLMAAARAQHVRDVISPALAAGRDVVTDRFAGSSIAYQGYGRGLAVDEVRSLSSFASGGLWPDLTVLLVVSAPLGAVGSPDRFEAAGDDFHARVEAGFTAQAAADPDGWVVISGEGTEIEVAERVLDVVRQRLR